MWVGLSEGATWQGVADDDWDVIWRGVGFGFQFRALSDQLYGTPEKHMNVRKAVVHQVGGVGGVGGMGLHVFDYF